jgi:hypothetical protein
MDLRMDGPVETRHRAACAVNPPFRPESGLEAGAPRRNARANGWRALLPSCHKAGALT